MLGFIIIQKRDSNYFYNFFCKIQTHTLCNILQVSYVSNYVPRNLNVVSRCTLRYTYTIELINRLHLKNMLYVRCCTFCERHFYILVIAFAFKASFQRWFESLHLWKPINQQVSIFPGKFSFHYSFAGFILIHSLIQVIRFLLIHSGFICPSKHLSKGSLKGMFFGSQLIGK